MRLGVIGFGNIATTLLGLMRQTGLVPEALTVLTLPESVDDVRASLAAEHAGTAADTGVVTDAAGLLAARPDLVVECAGHGAVIAHAVPVLQAGVDVVIVSIGALSDPALESAVRQAAADGGARAILPAGAIGGVDLLAALGAAGDARVRYRGTKPPRAWAGTPAEAALDLNALTAAATLFRGTARQAAQDYPKNANVAATLALAGAGFEATEVELVADPAAPGNVHEYSVTSPLANYTMRIENLPSAGNAKTSVTTVWSVLREIRNRMSTVAI